MPIIFLTRSNMAAMTKEEDELFIRVEQLEKKVTAIARSQTDLIEILYKLINN